jgi:metal-responsive CopG/Arc/MetJ family transcriptional regulator
MTHIRKDSRKPSSTISLESSLWEKIEDYRFDNRKPNRSAAIEELIQLGLLYAKKAGK